MNPSTPKTEPPPSTPFRKAVFGGSLIPTCCNRSPARVVSTGMKNFLSLVVVCFGTTTALCAETAPSATPKAVKAGDLDRRYIVHVPPKYDGKSPVPVVIMFHGPGRTREVFGRFDGNNDGFLDIQELKVFAGRVRTLENDTRRPQ
ncbi:MAG TPA: hypothetical protein VMY37_26505 [Thermoguttaceae bacterium]|nr:hypothetical protein [Thermoguttaceae bacterium]